MKTLIRNIVLNSFCLWIISLVSGAVTFSNKLEVLIFASISLAIVNLLVKPLLNLIFLPLNLITLGTFRWGVNIIVLFLVTVLVPGFHIRDFVFTGLNFSGFVIPAIRFNVLLSYLAVSFLLYLLSDMIYWLFK